MGTPEPDPVRARRALMDRLARSGKRVGYALLGVALAVFVVGAATSFTPVVVSVVVGSLAVGSVFLLPAIVVGYGVRAAERDDRDGGAGRVR
jgi:ABC-type Na+ efflux pump permease subunit